MALADKKYERLFSTTGSDADKIDNDKFTRIKNMFDNNEYLEDDVSFETLGALLYQLQKMQEEFDSLRDHIVNDVVGQAGAKGDKGDKEDTGAAGAAGTTDASKLDASRLPTSNRGLATGKLYNDRGTVKIA